MFGVEKRKHKTLTLQAKAEIIRKIENGAKLNDLAKFYGVGRATIHDIGKNREKIIDYLNGINVGHRKTMKSGEYPQVEEALHNWYLQQENKTISKQMLREKAKQFYKEIMHKDDFKASSGWLDKFKKRCGIGVETPAQELQPLTEHFDKHVIKLEAEPVDFIKKVKDKIEECRLLPDQVYHLQEGHLFWKLQPYKHFLRNMSESRLKIVSCVNASGNHKLPLMIIGNCKVKENFQIPVTYKNVFGHVMIKEIFVEWLQKDIIPEVKKTSRATKILLVLENSYEHFNEEEMNLIDETVQVLFLPKNTIHQKVIEALKTNYKNKFLVNLTSNGHTDVSNSLDQMSLQDTLQIIAEVWQNMAPDIITSLWSDFWPLHSFNCDGEKNESESFADSQISNILQSLIDKTYLKEEDIEAWLKDNHDDIIDGRMKECVESKDVVSHDNALAAFNTCIQWAEENGVAYEDVLVLRKMQSQVFVKKIILEDKGIKNEVQDEKS